MVEINISIDVPDLALATEFYCQALGCVKLRDQPPDMVVLESENTIVYLLKRTAGTKPLKDALVTRSFDRHWSPVHLDFLIGNVKGTVARIVESGGSCEGGEKGDWGEIAYCAVPFGNGFCVIRE